MDNTKNIIELPILITKEALVLPDVTQSIGVGRSISSKAVYASKDSYDSLIFSTAQKDPNMSDIKEDNIYEYGSLCRIISLNQDRKNFTLKIIANSRVRFNKIYFKDGCFYAVGEILKDEDGKSAIAYGYLNRLLDKAEKLHLIDVYRRHEGSSINLENNFYSLAYTILQFSNIPFEVRYQAFTCKTMSDL